MYRLIRRSGRALTATAVLLLPDCSVLSSGFMAPAGPIAAAERRYFLIVCLVMLLVVVLVFVLTPLLAWHYRLANTKSGFRPNWGFSWILEGLIWIPPTVIVLSVILAGGTVQLDPYRSLSQMVPPLQVEAVALDWKWLFIYPDQHLASVNRLVIPAGLPVHMVLTSGTVMQSLLMPNLAGQIYAMAGMTTQLNLVTSTSGTYWGENTQFNGLGFQKIKFRVLAVDPASFTHCPVDPSSQDQLSSAMLSQACSEKSSNLPLLPKLNTTRTAITCWAANDNLAHSVRAADVGLACLCQDVARADD